MIIQRVWARDVLHLRDGFGVFNGLLIQDRKILGMIRFPLTFWNKTGFGCLSLIISPLSIWLQVAYLLELSDKWEWLLHHILNIGIIDVNVYVIIDIISCISRLAVRIL